MQQENYQSGPSGIAPGAQHGIQHGGIQHGGTHNANPVVDGTAMNETNVPVDSHGVHHGDATYPSPHAAGATTIPHSGAALESGTHSSGQPVDPRHAAKGAGNKAMIGKIEHAIGSIIHSTSMKEKGLEKEREAEALKLQSRELNEAERLEHEAQLRRDRATAHGANPSHGANPAHTNAGLGAGSVSANEFGAGVGIGGAGGAGSMARGGY